MLKAVVFGAVITGCVALVIGSQGSSGGRLAIEAIELGEVRLFWSWPLFLSGSGLAWGLILLQR